MNLIGPIFFVAVIGLLWVFGERFPFWSEVTVYQAYCKEGRKDAECMSQEENTEPLTYKFVTEQQSIVYWLGDEGAPSKYNNCAIRNARNWSCILGDSRARGGPVVEKRMVGGEVYDFVDYQRVENDLTFYQVPKWYWWWLRFNAWNRPNR